MRILLLSTFATAYTLSVGCDNVGPPPAGTKVVRVRTRESATPHQEETGIVASQDKTALPDSIDAMQSVPGCPCGSGYYPVAPAEELYQKSLRATADSRFGEALDAASRASSVGLGRDVYENQLAIALFNAGRVQEALDHWHGLSQHELTGCELDFYASALNKLGRFTDAERIARRFIAQCNQSMEGHLTLFDSLDKQGKWAEALAEGRRAAALVPSSSRAHYCVASLLQKLGRSAEADTSATRAITAEASEPSTYYLRSIIRESCGRFNEALKDASHAVALRPRDPDYHYRVASVLWEMKRYTDAANEIVEATRLEPNNAQLLDFQSMIFEKCGRLDQALAAARASVAIEASPRHLGQLGSVLANLHRHREAIEILDQALGQQFDAGRMYQRAMSLSELGENRAALRDLREIEQRSPGHSNVREWITSLSP